MTPELFFSALDYIAGNDQDKKWPGDVHPGMLKTDDGAWDRSRTSFSLTEEGWATHAYVMSAGVRPKPTWAEIEAAANVVAGARARSSALKGIARDESRRICAAYIGDQDVPQTVEQEILYRLRASATDLAAKDAERDRLAGKARTLRAWIEDDARTLAELEAFDASADAHWAAESE